MGICTFVHAGVEPPGTDCSLLETSRDTPYSRVIQITKAYRGSRIMSMEKDPIVERARTGQHVYMTVCAKATQYIFSAVRSGVH